MIPFTLCEVPAPDSVSSSRSMLSNANVVGIQGRIFSGKGISSLSDDAVFCRHNAVSNSSNWLYEIA